jgi:hypothetical protein
MPMHNSKTPKTKILELYSNLINEYYSALSESPVMKELNYPISSTYIGINAIHRVFEIVLLKTKSIEKTYYYSQKAYYYYLEYLEQIYRANLSQNLNHMDIVLFVYKKTIFGMCDGDNNDSSHTLSNIMTLNNDTLVIDEKEWRTILVKIMKVTNVLFYWENNNMSFFNRFEISKKYLNRFIHKIDVIDTTLQYLEITQEKMDIEYTIYENLIIELLKKIESIRSKRDIFSNDVALMKFYIEEPICREKFENGNMHEFVRWLYC